MATKSRVEKASFISERLVVGLVRGTRLMSEAQDVKENSASHLIQDVQINTDVHCNSDATWQEISHLTLIEM